MNWACLVTPLKVMGKITFFFSIKYKLFLKWGNCANEKLYADEKLCMKFLNNGQEYNKIDGVSQFISNNCLKLI